MCKLARTRGDGIAAIYYLLMDNRDILVHFVGDQNEN